MNVVRAAGSYTPPATGRRSVRAARPVAGVMTVIAGARPPWAGSAANAGTGPAMATVTAANTDNDTRVRRASTSWGIGPPPDGAGPARCPTSCSPSAILLDDPGPGKHPHFWMVHPARLSAGLTTSVTNAVHWPVADDMLPAMWRQSPRRRDGRPLCAGRRPRRRHAGDRVAR